MRKDDLEKFLSHLEPLDLADLGVGLGLLRYADGLTLAHAAEELRLSAVRGYSRDQVLALVEAGLTDWLYRHIGAVADVLIGWQRLNADGLSAPRGDIGIWPGRIQPTMNEFVGQCMDAARCCQREVLVAQLQRAMGRCAAVGVPFGLEATEILDDDGIFSGYMDETPQVDMP